jgi:hypothetical protein
MDSDSDSDNRYQLSRSRSILSRDNWEHWFDVRELYFASKSISFVLKYTEAQYATTEKKRAKYHTASGKVRYEIARNISKIDQKFIRQYSSAKEVWDNLKAKYSIIRPEETRANLKRLTAYELLPGTKIEDAWVELHTLRRQIKAARPNWDIADPELFQYLLWGLPTEYEATVATIDAQPTLDFTDKFAILQNRQDQLNSTLYTAYPAKAQNKKPRCRRRKAKKQCFLCGAAHWVRQCTVWKDLATLARTARNNVRRPRKPKSKNTDYKSDSTNEKFHSTNRTAHKSHSTNQKSHSTSDSQDRSTTKRTKSNSTDQVTRTPTSTVRLKGEKSVQGECKARNKGEKHKVKHQEKHEDTAHEDAAYRAELKEWKRFLRHQFRSVGLL